MFRVFASSERHLVFGPVLLHSDGDQQDIFPVVLVVAVSLHKNYPNIYTSDLGHK